MNNNQSGKFAEFLARMFLRLKGYHICAANYITGRGTTAGEIDIIAVRGKTLIFVEVKKRSTLENAAYAVTPKQQKRLRTAEAGYLASHPRYKDFDIRFDAVLIVLPFRLTHIPNAF